MSVKNYLYLFISLWLHISCIKEEIKPCPPLQINIAVKDKNYFNINNVELEEYKEENLSFRDIFLLFIIPCQMSIQER